jgi:tRNA-2-methylthio-N6-dimethylallyladenosine synthase|tara:strand:- start:261 stop:731 length:471 start_codon:yes stop_codon:yes gene_type:complete
MHFSTDFIVGFPSETEDDFDLTVDLFEQVRFDMAFVFKYSERSGTVAADMPTQTTREVKEARNQRLLRVLEKHSLKRNFSLVGSVQEVLVEGPARKGNGMLMGRTRGYRKVLFRGNDPFIGEIIDVRIKDATTTTLNGELDLVDPLVGQPELVQAW